MLFSSTAHSSPAPSKQTLITTIVILIITVILAILISGSPESYHYEMDEYLTLDRSRSVAERGLWLNPEANHDPRLATKPPLQYWITASFMRLGMKDATAMRLVSVLFFSGLLFSMLSLAGSLRAGNLNLKLMILFIALSSPALIGLATRGLLDIGHGFFLMMMVSSVYLTERDAKWWYLVCLGWSLCFLQKSPIAFLMAIYLVLGVSLFVKQNGFKFSDLLKNRHFLIAWIGGILICSGYILLKLDQYGSEFLKETYVKETLQRFVPALPNDPTRYRGWGFIFYHLIQDGIVYWAGSFIMLLSFVFIKRRSISAKEWLLLIYMGWLFLIFMMAGGVIYFRYMSLLIPFIIIFVAISITELFKSSKTIQWILVIIMFISSFPIYQREWAEWRSSKSPDETFLYYIKIFKSSYECAYQPILIQSDETFEMKVSFEAMFYHLDAPWKLLTFGCRENCVQGVSKLSPGEKYFMLSESSLMPNLDSLMQRETTYYADHNYTVWKGIVNN